MAKVLLDDQLEEENEETEEETEETEESEEESTEESEENLPTDKQIKALQSAKDKETARANKLEADLKKALKVRNDAPAGDDDPERAAYLAEVREDRVDAVYAEFPLLADYKVSRSAIEGQTRSEMRESATQLVGLIKRVETRARNQALKDAGVADTAGSTRQPPKNYATMSDDDFEKELARGRTGGAATLNWGS